MRRTYVAIGLLIGTGGATMAQAAPLSDFYLACLNSGGSPGKATGAEKDMRFYGGPPTTVSITLAPGDSAKLSIGYKEVAGGPENKYELGSGQSTFITGAVVYQISGASMPQTEYCLRVIR